MPTVKKTAKELTREELEKLTAEEAQLKMIVHKSRRAQELSKTFFATYIAIMAIAATTILSSLTTSGVGHFFRSGDNQKDGSNNSSLQIQLNQLKQQVSDVQEQIKKKNSTPDIAAVSARVDRLQSQLDALSATILESPDKALTARLLREKQANLESQVEGLKSDNDATRQDFVNLVVVVFGAPLMGGVITVVIDRLRHSKTKDE